VKAACGGCGTGLRGASSRHAAGERAYPASRLRHEQYIGRNQGSRASPCTAPAAHTAVVVTTVTLAVPFTGRPRQPDRVGRSLAAPVPPSGHVAIPWTPECVLKTTLFLLPWRGSRNMSACQRNS
jgi:hypothetical protein